MATITNINVGLLPNDGTGDTLRNSQIKANDNFAELNSKKVEVIVGKGLSTNDFTNAYKFQLDNLVYLNYTAENVANKSLTLAYDGTGIKYASVDAVNLGLNNFARAMVQTGFIEAADTFNITRLDDFNFRLLASDRGIIFKSKLVNPPFAPNQAILNIAQTDIPLSSLGLSVDGVYIRFIGVNDTGTIVYSTATFQNSISVCQLGILLVKRVAGVTSFLSVGRDIIVKPSIAAYSNLELTLLDIKGTVQVLPIVGTMTVSNTAGAILGMSVNWAGVNNDKRDIASDALTDFGHLNPGNALVSTPPPFVTTVTTDQYWNGTALTPLTTNSYASVQRWLLTVNGRIHLQYGETQYSNFDQAKAAVSVAPFTDILPITSFVEIGRLVATKNCANLSDPTQAQFYVAGASGLGGGGGGTGGPTVWGTITGSITSQTDLNTALVSKHSGTITSGKIPKSAGSNFFTDSNISDNGTTVTITNNAIVNGKILGTGAYNTSSNTAFGENVLGSNINGTDNTGVGNGALASASIGAHRNSAFGRWSLTNLTGGVDNSAFGVDAISGIVNGIQNIGFGNRAGVFLADGTTINTASNNSIFLGYGTRAFAASGANEIVIGANAIGKGSNTVTIGNASITNNYFTGAVTANSFVKVGGTNAQFLMADGSVSTGSGGGFVTSTGATNRIAIFSSPTNITSATSGVDYSAGTYALATGILKSTTGTGALTIATASDFPTLNTKIIGTNGYVARFDTTLGITDSIIFVAGAGVSINKTAPAGALDVSGSVSLGTFTSGNNNRTVIDVSGGSRLTQYNSSGTASNSLLAGGVSYFNGGNLIVGGTTDVTGDMVQVSGNIYASGFKKSGGTAAQFLKANGSTDSTLYAPIASPTFTGIPSAPTAANGTNTTQIATTAFVLANSGTGGGDMLKAVYDTTNNGIVDNSERLGAQLPAFYATDSLVLHLAGSETITGTKSFTVAGASAPVLNVTNNFANTLASGITITNSNTGRALGITNSVGSGIFLDLSSGTGLNIVNAAASAGVGIKINNNTTATGNAFTYQKNSVDKVTINDAGNILAQQFVRSVGTASDFLKADGSIDSNSYALASTVHNPVTIGTANGLSLATQVLSLQLATSSVPGALSAADWTTFNNKQSALTNPVTGTGTANNVGKWTGTNTIGNGTITDTGSLITLGSNTTVTTGNLTFGATLLSEKLLQMNNASLSTGLYEFGSGGITMASATQVNIGNVKGWIVDSSDHLNSNPTFVDYPGVSNQTVPDLGSSTATYFLITPGSTLLMQHTRPTVTERRDNIFLGVVGHPAGTLTGIGNSPDIIMNYGSQLRAMMEPTRLINEGVAIGANGVNLALANTAGQLYGMGIGFIANGNDAPSVLSIAAGAPTTFQYRTQTGVATADSTLVIPGSYDVAGTVTAVGGSSGASTNQRAYLLQNGVIRFQYGQTVYATLADAIAGASSETFVVFSNNKTLGILIGILSINKSCTNLSDTATARFLPVSKFGETVGAAAGIAIGNLQTTYNNSATPNIITNGTLFGLSIRRGSAADTDNIFLGQNGAGTTTFTLLGNGAVTALSLAVTGGTSGGFLKANGTVDTTAYTTNLGTVTSVAALTLGTSGTDLNSSVATGTTTPVITLNVPTASAANRGALSSTDWNTFNNKQATLVSATNIKTINSLTLLGSGNLAVQEVLVSATNIKTINGSSILGSGDLVVSGGGGGALYYKEPVAAPSVAPTSSGLSTIVIGDGAKGASNYSFVAGASAGGTSTSNAGLIAIGRLAGANITGANNVCLNQSAGTGNSGANNNFIGQTTGQNGSGSFNNFIGYLAGDSAGTTANSNFLGQSAGQLITNASNSNFFGQKAGYATTKGTYSNLFGFQAGMFFSGNDIGDNNIIIGTNISIPNNTSNAINIGGIIFGINTYNVPTGNPSIAASSSGKIGIGRVTPTEVLDVNGSVIATGYKIASGTSTQVLTANGGTIDSAGAAGWIKKDDGPTYDTNAIKTVTAAEYAAIGTKDPNTLYFVI